VFPLKAKRIQHPSLANQLKSADPTPGVPFEVQESFVLAECAVDLRPRDVRDGSDREAAQVNRSHARDVFGDLEEVACPGIFEPDNLKPNLVGRNHDTRKTAAARAEISTSQGHIQRGTGLDDVRNVDALFDNFGNLDATVIARIVSVDVPE
jgi:hypothetical protein